MCCVTVLSRYIKLVYTSSRKGVRHMGCRELKEVLKSKWSIVMIVSSKDTLHYADKPRLPFSCTLKKWDITTDAGDVFMPKQVGTPETRLSHSRMFFLRSRHDTVPPTHTLRNHALYFTTKHYTPHTTLPAQITSKSSAVDQASMAPHNHPIL